MFQHEKTYPYVAGQSDFICQDKPYWNPGAKVVDSFYDGKCNETELMKLIYKYGAVSTAVSVQNGFKGFKSGVLDTCKE